MSHTHNFKESEWPFDIPINTATFTTRHVVEGTHPILEVYHDHDGEWQFMCGTTTASADAKLVCFGCMIDRDPTILQLANMPSGWVAYRASSNKPWSREEYEDSDEPDEV
jgi:hypothetical protein